MRSWRRDTGCGGIILIPALKAAGFRCFPRGEAYYVMTDISAFGFADDVTFVKYLVKEIGVAAVPGSSFYRDARMGAAGAVCVLQKVGDAGCGSGEVGEAGAGVKSEFL